MSIDAISAQDSIDSIATSLEWGPNGTITYSGEIRSGFSHVVEPLDNRFSTGEWSFSGNAMDTHIRDPFEEFRDELQSLRDEIAQLKMLLLEN
jgi:hypothetical protein